MLTIVCGEDSAASRTYFSDLKNQYIKSNYQIVEVDYQQIKDIPDWAARSASLYFDQSVFFTHNINKFISTRSNGEFVKLLQKIANAKNIRLIDWEEGRPAREIKLKQFGVIKEFKLPDSIFKLQDQCYPGNRLAFLQILQKVSLSQDEYFIFVMIARHIRNLILAKINCWPKSASPWQKSKLSQLTRYWSLDSLLLFYHGLFRIDLSTKTGRNPQGVKKSLDILASSCL